MKTKNTNKRIKKWSDFLADAAIHPSNVYSVGLQFVYDHGQLPSGMTNITPGDILNLQRENGLSACDVPGHVDDWVTIDGNPGDGGGGSGSSVVTESSIPANPTDQQRGHVPTVGAVADALAGKMNASQAFKTINGQSIKGSGNITVPECKCEVPFTSELQKKLMALPTITLNGNTITINGTAYTLAPAGSTDPEEPVAGKDYYVGFTNGSKSEFAALSASQLTALSEGYMISSMPQYEHAYGDNQIFFLMYQADKAPKTVNLISSGQTMAQDLANDNTCPHDPVTIDGATYQIFGIRLSSTHDATDTMSLTF